MEQNQNQTRSIKLRADRLTLTAYLTDVLERMIAGRTKITEIEDLLPWNWQPAAVAPLQAAA
jgi:hypothetical protein